MEIDVTYIKFKYIDSMVDLDELALDSGMNKDLILLKAKSAILNGRRSIDVYKDDLHPTIKVIYSTPKSSKDSYAELDFEWTELFKSDDDLYSSKKRYLYKKRLYKMA